MVRSSQSEVVVSSKDENTCRRPCNKSNDGQIQPPENKELKLAYVRVLWDCWESDMDLPDSVVEDIRGMLKAYVGGESKVEIVREPRSKVLEDLYLHALAAYTGGSNISLQDVDEKMRLFGYSDENPRVLKVWSSQNTKKVFNMMLGYLNGFDDGLVYGEQKHAERA